MKKTLKYYRNSGPATMNAELTNYGQAFVADLSKESLAAWIAPWVVTGRASGQFKKYDDAESFQIYETERAPGSERNRIVFAATDPYFHCKPNGLEIGTDDFEIEEAGGDFDVLAAKTRMLVSTAFRSREKKVWDKIKAGKSATGSIGSWSDLTTNDPIKEINAEIKAVADDTGTLPNRIALGLSAWALICDHAKVIARKQGVSENLLTLAQFSAMLLNPAIEARVGIIPYNTNKRGLAKSNSNVLGAEVFIFHGTDTPDTFDPSFAKSFSTRGSGVDAVQTWTTPSGLMTLAAVDWSEDVQVTAPAAGRRITVT